MNKKSDPVYIAWRGAKQRVSDPNTEHWHRYGGRGLTMCEHWLSDFSQFAIDMGPRPIGKSIDRKDNNLGYLCPLCCAPNGNCRWATKKEQASNTIHVEIKAALLEKGPEIGGVPVHVEAVMQQASAVASRPTGISVHNWRRHWLTTVEFARVMGRHPQTVYWWLRNDTLAEFGIPIMHFRQGRRHSGRVFIQNIF